jgi:NADH-quinone oxidoreductase subunit J
VLVDGGVCNNTPISDAATLGATQIYVLPTGGTCRLPSAPQGAVQMLVYAGGIMVLFLFVVMLVNPGVVAVGKAFQTQFDVALVMLPVFLLPFLYILGTEKLPDVAARPDAFRMVGDKIAGNTEAVAWVLFRDYLVPFEVASVFLLVAMVGAVVLGKRSLEKMD